MALGLVGLLLRGVLVGTGVRVGTLDGLGVSGFRVGSNVGADGAVGNGVGVG